MHLPRRAVQRLDAHRDGVRRLRLRRTSFFDATLDGCKLVGSTFSECVLRPLTVTGGSWLGVTMRGAKLARVDLSGVDLREADLSLSDLTLASLRGARLDRALLRETVLDRADLRGASLDGVDLSAAGLSATRLDLAGAVLLAELHGADVDPSASVPGIAPGIARVSRDDLVGRTRVPPTRTSLGTRAGSGEAGSQAVDHQVEAEVEVGQRLERPLDGAEADGLAGGLLLEGVAEDVVDERARGDGDAARRARRRR